MDFRETIILERYKLVTSRQDYLVDLTTKIFSAYAKTLAAFVAGSIALVSLPEKLAINSGTAILDLVGAIVVFLSFAGVLSSVQIYFCIKRWFEYRRAECAINPRAPRPEKWGCVFEWMYIFAIVGSIFLIWYGYQFLEGIFCQLVICWA